MECGGETDMASNPRSASYLSVLSLLISNRLKIISTIYYEDETVCM